MTWQIIAGDCRSTLAGLPERSVQTCVTSPPYFGLRDYGTGEWEGGEADCDHAPTDDQIKRAVMGKSGLGTNHAAQEEAARSRMMPRNACPRCGARRVDLQIGLEPTPDEFVAALVGVFREVRRVLRDDGTVWLNLGDSYAGSWGAQSRSGAERGGQTVERNEVPAGPSTTGKVAASLSATQIAAHPRGTRTGSIPSGAEYKPKDLIGIPWLVAFALRADGWVLRSEIVWNKPNPMPESVTDRPTKAHEQLFLFSKARWTGAEEPLPMRAIDAAWLAALVDGEGTICFQNRTSERASQDTYSVRLSIVNTNRALLDRVTAICGAAGVGTPSPRLRGDGSTGRPIYTWQATNAKAARVIAAIRPYLIAKQQQADLALYVQDLNRKHTGRGGYSVSKADQAGKARAAAACSDLNHGREVDLSWFTAVKPGRWVPLPYSYDADAIREDGTGRTAGNNGHVKGAGNDDPFFRTREGFAAVADKPWHDRNKRSVWTVSTQPYAGAHFATFPPKLIEPCILAGCPEGGTVLDPFAGSGTTGMVALRHNRSFIGLELNPEYAQLARDRIVADCPLHNTGLEIAA